VRRGEVTRVWWKGAGNDLNGLGSSSHSSHHHTFSTEKLTFGRKAISRTNYVFFLFTDLLAITKRKSDEHYVVVDHCPRNLVQMQEIDNAENLGIPGLSSSSKRDSVELSFAWLTLLQSGHENKTVEWLLSFPAASTSASECDRAAWITAVTPRSQSREVTTSSASVSSPIQNGDPEVEEEKIYEEWDCPQIEVTEEYNGAKSLNNSVNENEVLDMQKGDKANVLRKLSESGSSTTRQDENECNKSSTSPENKGTNETTNKEFNRNDTKEYEGPIDANNDIKETSNKKKKESNDSTPEVSRL